MARFTSPLDNIKVASPCSANWDEMYGSDRKRLCGQCDMNVYNLSAMTKQEAERLIMNAEGRLCARFYRRPDGTILTKNCPVGWEAAKQRMTRIWSAAASILVTFFASLGLVSLLKGSEQPEIMGEIAIERPHEFPIMGAVEPEMGDVAPSDLNYTVGRVAVEEVK